jgi:membrane protein YqaA with SNARE-associated domain
LADPARTDRACLLAAAWGVAEATFFFIVPDVLLSWLAIQNYRRAMVSCAWATAGALIGGLIIWWVGAANPDLVRAIFEGIPAINEQMIGNVEDQLDSRGLLALFIGPLVGTPYKIYALQAAGAGFGLLIFLLVSIPARLMRFVIVTTLAAGGSRVLRKFVGIRVLQLMHIVVWTSFYAWYFHVMGVY